MTIIAHTTDRSGRDRAAFVHACALASASSAHLVTVHGNAPPGTESELPDAAPLAERWSQASGRAVAIAHERRCHECCEDVTDTLLDALRKIRPALVITGMQPRHGLAAWLHASVSEALARNLEVPTLVVPNLCVGFADEATGKLSLERLLVPAADATSAGIGLAAARALCAMGGIEAAELVVLHVGEHDLALPGELERGVRVVRRRGNLEKAIAETARQERSCAIVMPTHGHDGVRDTIWGSHTEHVVRDANCPVLVVPMRGHGEG